MQQYLYLYNTYNNNNQISGSGFKNSVLKHKKHDKRRCSCNALTQKKNKSLIKKYIYNIIINTNNK